MKRTPSLTKAVEAIATAAKKKTHVNAAGAFAREQGWLTDKELEGRSRDGAFAQCVHRIARHPSRTLSKANESKVTRFGAWLENQQTGSGVGGGGGNPSQSGAGAGGVGGSKRRARCSPNSSDHTELSKRLAVVTADLATSRAECNTMRMERDAARAALDAVSGGSIAVFPNPSSSPSRSSSASTPPQTPSEWKCPTPSPEVYPPSQTTPATPLLGGGDTSDDNSGGRHGVGAQGMTRGSYGGSQGGSHGSRRVGMRGHVFPRQGGAGLR
jgi:hypothetical protein